MDTGPVALHEAAAIETAEASAWTDLYAAAPSRWAESAGVGSHQIGGAFVLYWAASGRRYFSRAIGLGVTTPASEDELDQIIGVWRKFGIDMFLVNELPHCRPAAYAGWLNERGLDPFDAQDRIVRGDQPANGPAGPDLHVEQVTRTTADEWSEFMQRVYRLDTGPWLPRLIDRPRWYQYVARDSGQIVAARGMYIGPDGTAWLGMDGPVPGLSTDDYEPDAAICRRIVADGLARGAATFIADIEAPSPTMDTPAYEHFAELGFRRPYVRTHHARVP